MSSLLNDVTILITAGYRPGYLANALRGISAALPECTVVVVKDRDGSDTMPVIIRNTYIWAVAGPDEYLTAKRNMGVDLIATKYTLMASDDFTFDAQTRASVIKMANFLEQYSEYSLVAGTYNGKHYEGHLIVEDDYVKEVRLPEMAYKEKGDYWSIDIAANWFLAHTSALRDVPWDETIGPIGGEHADWFLSLREAQRYAAWLSDAPVFEQLRDKTKEHPDYSKRRFRAQEGHQKFLAKRGLKRYYGFDEEVK